MQYVVIYQPAGLTPMGVEVVEKSSHIASTRRLLTRTGAEIFGVYKAVSLNDRTTIIGQPELICCCDIDLTSESVRRPPPSRKHACSRN
jgi:hypothetical protein